jgi:hypothetical protein
MLGYVLAGTGFATLYASAIIDTRILKRLPFGSKPRKAAGYGVLAGLGMMIGAIPCLVLTT